MASLSAQQRDGKSQTGQYDNFRAQLVSVGFGQTGLGHSPSHTNSVLLRFLFRSLVRESTLSNHFDRDCYVLCGSIVTAKIARLELLSLKKKSSVIIDGKRSHQISLLAAIIRYANRRDPTINKLIIIG